MNQNEIYEVGQIYLIRTVTMYNAGRLVFVGNGELVLEDACWIADTGKYSEALLNINALNEIEMYPQGKKVIIGRGAIVDAVIPNWTELPTETK
uniref:Uncharacterized protein n=1 Tax=viral metagenome TaxID=1070528 RepID=A0A6M3JHZ6_9ZZZZ